MFDIFLKGLLFALAIIAAIGAQNAFLLKQGLIRSHVGLIIWICFLSDAILMAAGVFGLGIAVSKNPIALIGITGLGAAFIAIYGLKTFINVFSSNASLTVDTQDNSSKNWKKIALTTIALTWLNPHVYIDTVFLVGSVSSAYTLMEKPFFLLGTISGSLVWFVLLGYGSRLLAPLFRSPTAWRILDGIITVVMWWIAFELTKYCYGLIHTL